MNATNWAVKNAEVELNNIWFCDIGTRGQAGQEHVHEKLVIAKMMKLFSWVN